MARVSGEPIGVMSLSEKSLLLRFPVLSRHPNASGTTIDHDFVIEA
jgi:hypothetical protein